jgi:preprotein translocase subunit YajC
MSFFLSDAMAQAAPAGVPQGPDGLSSFILFGGMIVLLYFFMIRPQVKRQKEHRQLVEALAKGDEVQTDGGLLGKVAHLGDEVVRIEIADGVQIKIRRQSIAAVLPKGSIAEM